MTKRFEEGLEKAWFQYQDLYDRHRALLRAIGESDDLGSLQETFESQVDYALNSWSTPQERFEQGGYDDFDLGLGGPEEDEVPF